MKQRSQGSFFQIMMLALLAACLFSCGTLDMGPHGKNRTAQRRAYVNDVATNDSLRSALLRSGMYFVMQPGKRYSLKLEGAVEGDYLQVLAASGNVYTFWKDLHGSGIQGGTQTYTMQDSLATSANYFLAFLRTPTGLPGTRPTKVRLVPADTVEPDTVKVRLVMVRTLSRLTDNSLKEAFAHTFLQELAGIYKGQNIVLDTSFQIVEPTGPRFTVEFTDNASFPGGARVANTIYLYLVENITLDGKSDDEATILGFAPREAFDLASSQVVLSMEAYVNPQITLTTAALGAANTAAHEMGHFIGLRHTTSTELDQRGDDDLTNVQDGFVNTPMCGGLKKRMAAPAALQNIPIHPGRPYCLRVAVEACSDCDDKENLMFPYACQGISQKTLVPEQSEFIRRNLSLFQR